MLATQAFEGFCICAAHIVMLRALLFSPCHVLRFGAQAFGARVLGDVNGKLVMLSQCHLVLLTTSTISGCQSGFAIFLSCLLCLHFFTYEYVVFYLYALPWPSDGGTGRQRYSLHRNRFTSLPPQQLSSGLLYTSWVKCYFRIGVAGCMPACSQISFVRD